MNCKYWIRKRTFFGLILLLTGSILTCQFLNSISQASENPAPSPEAGQDENDISDIEITEIELIIGGLKARLRQGSNPNEEMVLIQLIDRVQNLRNKYPSSPKFDHLLYLSGLSKSLLGQLGQPGPSDRSPSKAYFDKHADEYDHPYLATVYKGDDFKELIRKFPESRLVDDAAFELAMSKTRGGECESDLDCRIQRSLEPLLPFLKNYPTSNKVRDAVREINYSMDEMLCAECGRWDIYDIQKTGALLNEYYDALLVANEKNKYFHFYDAGGYSLARALISVGEYDRASHIYKELKPRSRYAIKDIAHLVFDYTDEKPYDIPATVKFNTKLEKFRDQLTSNDEASRLKFLGTIDGESIPDEELYFLMLLAVAERSENDPSSAVRRKAIEALGKLAPKTVFYRTAVYSCIFRDEALDNRHQCVTLIKTDPNLAPTDNYPDFQKVMDDVETQYFAQKNQRAK